MSTRPGRSIFRTLGGREDEEWLLWSRGGGSGCGDPGGSGTSAWDGRDWCLHGGRWALMG